MNPYILAAVLAILAFLGSACRRSRRCEEVREINKYRSNK